MRKTKIHSRPAFLLLSIAILAALIGAPASARADKVTICHHPPGNTDNPRTIEVKDTAVSAHLEHGDSVGECEGAECGNGVLEEGEDCERALFEDPTFCSDLFGVGWLGEVTCLFSCELDTRLCSLCGNGTREGIEECDDGNTTSGDSCESNCTFPSPPPPPP